MEAFDADAVTGGKFDRGELTLEIAPAKIVSVCGFLKYDQKFVRLSTVTAVDRYPAEPRFEVVYHLHSIERNERVRLKCRLRGRGSGDRIGDFGVAPARTGTSARSSTCSASVSCNHPDLRRIMMPDDWEGHPLRKDYPVTGSRV